MTQDKLSPKYSGRFSLYVFSTVVAGGGNSGGIVGNGVHWVNGCTNDAQCIAEISVGNIACTVFEVQASIGQAGTQIF